MLQHTTHDAPRVRGLLELYFDGMVPREVVDNAPDMINHFTTSPYILSELAARREAALQTLPATNE